MSYASGEINDLPAFTSTFSMLIVCVISSFGLFGFRLLHFKLRGTKNV